MRHLFSPEGEAALAAVMRLKPLLAFDFDGTLAPIVALPDRATVPEAVVTALKRLAQQRPVAIVTGRRVADVPPRLGFQPDYIVGNHGAEEHGVRLPMAADVALDSLRERIVPQLEALAAAGVMVEDKQFSLALHYRLAQDRDVARRRIDELLQGLDPALGTFGGKLVVNVVATEAPDKGVAVHALVGRSESGAAVFVGDDLNDEAVFKAAPPHWLTVRIGRDDPDSKAMFFLDSHVEVINVLYRMLELLAPPPT